MMGVTVVCLDLLFPSNPHYGQHGRCGPSKTASCNPACQSVHNRPVLDECDFVGPLKGSTRVWVHPRSLPAAPGLVTAQNLHAPQAIDCLIKTSANGASTNWMWQTRDENPRAFLQKSHPHTGDARRHITCAA